MNASDTDSEDSVSWLEVPTSETSAGGTLRCFRSNGGEFWRDAAGDKTFAPDSAKLCSSEGLKKNAVGPGERACRRCWCNND